MSYPRFLDPARMKVFRCLARMPLGWGSTRWFFLPSFGNFSKVRCATPTLQVFRNQRQTLARKAADQSCLSRPNGSSPHTLVGFFANPLSPKQQLLLLFHAAIQHGFCLLCLENQGNPIFCLLAIPQIFMSPQRECQPLLHESPCFLLRFFSSSRRTFAG